MSPWPLSGISLIIYKIRLTVASTSPRLFAGIMVNVGPLIKGFKVVYIPGGYWSIRK